MHSDHTSEHHVHMCRTTCRVSCNLTTRKSGTRIPVQIPDGYPGTKIYERPSTVPAPAP